MRRLSLALGALALLLPQAALARGDFGKKEVEDEFNLPDWIPIHLGGLNLSVNKAVVYLLLGAVVAMALGILLMRVRLGLRPGVRQTIGEQIYEVAQTQIAEPNLPSKAIGRWFPYVASLMLFIWTLNFIGFIPLPISNDHVHVAGVRVPTLAIYAATAQLSVTLMLAIVSVGFSHVEGIRAYGLRGHLHNLVPPTPKLMKPFIAMLEFGFSQPMRVISLAVRLYANMLAGHILILVFIGISIVLESIPVGVVTVLAAAIFYVFEVAIVVSIQAFIFAALSAIYIGTALEPAH